MRKAAGELRGHAVQTVIIDAIRQARRAQTCPSRSHHHRYRRRHYRSERPDHRRCSDRIRNLEASQKEKMLEIDEELNNSED